MTDENWFSFSVETDIRGKKIKENSRAGTVEVNPDLPDGRRALDYPAYLNLERLLAAQFPGSMVPDERVFVITHQLFELTFKLMVFDAIVIVDTFDSLLKKMDKEFLSLALVRGKDNFWLPAMTASARLKYSSRQLLPSYLGYLGNFEGKDETFNGLEYGKFRDYLPPASGFQSAQFRLLQRAFGKSVAQEIRLFPGGEYARVYENAADPGVVKINDEFILREGLPVAKPGPDSPLARVEQLDRIAHQALERLAGFGGEEASVTGVKQISAGDVELSIESFRRILGTHRKYQRRAGSLIDNASQRDEAAEDAFRQDLEKAVKAENERRKGLMGARRGAAFLYETAPRSNLMRVLKRLESTDDALHGTHDDSFLSLHYRVAADRINELTAHAKESGSPEPPIGTGGGGVPYLGHVRKNLIPLFPNLIANRGLVDYPEWGWMEHAPS